MDEALYGADGFYACGGGAGRHRDFITSPEVGPLFGAVLARALDTWWNELGCPSPFMVAECGAGPGTLCRDILRAEPHCGRELRYILVDVAEPMRALHRTHRLPLVEATELRGEAGFTAEGDYRVFAGQGPLVASVASLPGEGMHVVLANELLDNLPFDIAQRADDHWSEVRVGLDASNAFGPVLIELDPLRSEALDAFASGITAGATVPLQRAASSWIASARAALAAGRSRVVVIDYGASLVELGTRAGAWMRTYRAHERGIDPFSNAGLCDITADVAIDFVSRSQTVNFISTQAEFLVEHGISDLVAEARLVWSERAGIGDLAALAARSRVGEADALLDPNGLGAFIVTQWISRTK